MIFRSTLAVSLASVAIGLPLAMAEAWLLRSLLYGVRPGDPWILASFVGGLALVAIGASIVPALRASSVDPNEALKSEQERVSPRYFLG